MDLITPEVIFDIALKTQICDKKTMDIDLFSDGIRLHLPTQRSLESHCSVPHVQLMASLFEMENMHLIEKRERIGIWTTPLGNQMAADIIERKYKKQARALFGRMMLEALLDRLKHSLPEDSSANTVCGEVAVFSCDQNEQNSSVDTKILNVISCKCCQKRIYTNDRRLKYCNQCRQLSQLKKFKLQQVRE